MTAQTFPQTSSPRLPTWAVLLLILAMACLCCGCAQETTPDNPTHALGQPATPSVTCLDGFVVCLGGGDACTGHPPPSAPACLARYERCIRAMPCTFDDTIGCFEDWPPHLRAQGPAYTGCGQ